MEMDANEGRPSVCFDEWGMLVGVRVELELDVEKGPPLFLLKSLPKMFFFWVGVGADDWSERDVAVGVSGLGGMRPLISGRILALESEGRRYRSSCCEVCSPALPGLLLKVG
jgi:hypothetical protein